MLLGSKSGLLKEISRQPLPALLYEKINVATPRQFIAVYSILLICVVTDGEMAVPKVKLNNEGLADLHQALRDCLSRSADARYGLRLVCLLLVSAGFGCADVGPWFGKTGRTVQRWVHDFQSRGFAGLRDEHRPGRAGEFSSEELAQLREDLGHTPGAYRLEASEWTAELLAEHIKHCYKRELGGRQALRLLHRLMTESVARNATTISGHEG
jgi:transposase